jgi:hypothetical protein
MKRPERVTICEVRTRDGFQMRTRPGQLVKAGKWRS